MEVLYIICRNLYWCNSHGIPSGSFSQNFIKNCYMAINPTSGYIFISEYIFKGNEIIISKRNLYSHVHCINIHSSLARSLFESLQSCPTLCDPIDGSPPGSPVPGILQARTLEWVAISFSNAWKSKVKVKSLSRVRLLATPWTIAYQAPPSVGFSRQECWSGVPLPSLSQ